MHAQIIRQFGSADVFEPAETERPAILPGHVLIRVAATSVNPIDIRIRNGAVPNVTPDLPAILHGDVAGVIEEVGEGVDSFQAGDEVFACAGGIRNTHGGALADYLLADASLVAPKPRSLSFQEAAAIPLVAITAWEAVFDRGRVQKQQNVLIHAGTGGVGHMALQLAKTAEANIYTTVSGRHKAELAGQLGADHTINYRETEVAAYVKKYTNGEGFDVVIDTVGGANIDRSFQAAKMNGTVVTIASRSAHDLTPMHNKGLTLHVVFMIIPFLTGKGLSRYGQILRRISQWADEGKIKPLLDEKTYSFNEVSEAHKRLESGQAIGKVVLVNEYF
ncbi:zinc-dependent alcohol dehydrogenase family protein [Thermoactinomyces mirandus]|uniref:Zinc-dependent alcohol dehydrogenase family protein n=1 Tax=Thermoactinomyces mirandus TaxID=2756294 RepID=A0A7W2AST3_9BACL|nr:zinc-dependent alcohol dehydrogenase family protein [Thermoactinomyces mirandus]MBA4602811.1 zinc-dependent alcohol dehydrogenase family protein [Thermoactinomyces mirandus]